MSDQAGASNDVLAAYGRLATQVCAELARAGLVSYRGNRDVEGRPGAEVEIHAAVDGSGGVSVSWITKSELLDEVQDAIFSGQTERPVVAYYEAIKGTMRNAIKSILSAAGFTVEIVEEMSPVLYVRSAPGNKS
ncbi:hypothetical protein ACFWY9_40345 [Amycolatopsis sp. NPDC059027]|uniref:hypothetical protein n=1 Tax=Amycolatopsis sp. NPDC059027 TaxID=3346709 RepID=UPI003672D050